MPSPQDISFAKLAVELKLLSSEQARHGLSWLEAREDPRSFPRLCQDYGVLDAAQVEIVEAELQERSAPRFAEFEALTPADLGEVPFRPVPPTVFVEPPQTEAQPTSSCPHCQRDIVTKGRYCPFCGKEREAAPSRPRPRLRLEVLAGPAKGHSAELDVPGSVVVGRIAELSFLGADPGISRRHCMIDVCPPRVRLLDLGSRNGTFVNDEEVAREVELEAGDRIRLGQDTELSWELVDCFTTQLVLKVPCGTCGETLPHCACATRPSGAAGLEHVHFPGLTVLRILGEGSNGMVFLAKNEAGDRVAVKTRLPERGVSSSEITRFLNEANYGSQVDHPNAVRIFGSGYHEGVFYFVMEYVQGNDCHREIEIRQQPFSLAEGIDIVRKVAGAVRAAHQKGLVHRDIKPANIVLARLSGGHTLPKLTDFGLMRQFTDAGLSFTSTGQGMGTPHFMAPEQVDNARSAGPPADVYGLGATLFYLLTAQAPLDLEGVPHPLVAVAEGRRLRLRHFLPGAPAHLDETIARCLALKAEDRLQSVEELEQLLDDVAPQTRRLGPASRLRL